MNNGKENRPTPISYRPPVGLRDEFALRVQKSGLSVSGYISKCIFNIAPPKQSKRPAIEQKLLAKLLGEAAKIHEDFRSIRNSSELSPEHQALFEDACKDLTIIRAALLKSMGRQP